MKLYFLSLLSFLNSIIFIFLLFGKKMKSILINGRGQFNCSLAAQFSNATAQFSNTSLPMCKFKKGDQCAPQRLHVEPNKTYRIRLASTTGLASLNFAVQVRKVSKKNFAVQVLIIFICFTLKSSFKNKRTYNIFSKKYLTKY